MSGKMENQKNFNAKSCEFKNLSKRMKNVIINFKNFFYGNL